jgi:hypothetical protein
MTNDELMKVLRKLHYAKRVQNIALSLLLILLIFITITWVQAYRLYNLKSEGLFFVCLH